MSKQKILLFDLECLPNIVASFGIWNQNIPPKAILETTSIISIAWKWLGERKTHSITIADFKGWKENVYDDSGVVAYFADVLKNADVVVGHNVDKFDTKYFNTRLLYHGHQALPKIQSIDTYKVAKAKFRLNSNKLAYLANFLGCTPKDDMEFEDWLGVIRAETKAVKKMERYNVQDVDTLEEVYNKLLSYIPSHPNHNLYSSGDCCAACGSINLQRRGYSYTKIAKKQRYQCQDCGSWSVGGKSEKIVNIRGL